MEKYGAEVMKAAVVNCGQTVKVLYEVLVEKKGLWHLLQLQSVSQALIGLDFKKLKLELSDLSEPEREGLMADFKASLPAAVAAKVGPGVDLLEEAIDLAEDGIAFVSKAIVDVKAFIEKAKAMFGA